jgi:DNA-binding NarL/FixJ family response regulator
MALLQSGSEGRAYLLKKRIHDRAQLVAAIESVAAGGSVVDSKIVEPLVTARGYVQRRRTSCRCQRSSVCGRDEQAVAAPAAAAGLRRKAAPGHLVVAPGARPDDAERST